jgi:cytosine/adenosine deaminase-related metal-dependent hydrolase
MGWPAQPVWTPRSNVTLYGNTAVVTAAKRLGVNIALGTDWIPTGSMNMFRELTCADELNSIYYDNTFTDRDLWRMVTINAARALHADEVIGSIDEGLVADIAIYDAKTPPTRHHRWPAGRRRPAAAVAKRSTATR